MSEYLCASCNRNYVRENTCVCLIDNLRAALRILFNFEYLDLNINPDTVGLRFYTEFNRLDAPVELCHN